MEKGRSIAFQNPDIAFANLTGEPVILNHLPARTLADREAIDNHVMTIYGKDTQSLDSLPTCRCGKLTGSINLGAICQEPTCKTRVDFDHTREIEASVWIECPEVIHGMFSPAAYNMLSTIFESKSWNGFEWLCKTTYRAPEPTNKSAVRIMNILINSGIPRGLNNVIMNLPKVLDIASELYASSKGSLEDIHDVFRITRNDLTCKHIAIPSKIALVIENTALGSWRDKSIRYAMEAVRMTAYLEEEDASPNKIGNALTTIMANLRLYWKEAFGKPFGAKPGMLRKANFGSRKDYTLRAVVTSITGVHDYRAMNIPYAQACVVFRNHLMNILINKEGMSHRDADEYIDAKTALRDPEMEARLDSLLRSKDGGYNFSMTATRYPTLSRGSTQKLFIGGISDKLEISILVIKASNCDFDGDELTCTILLSDLEERLFQPLEPHHDVHNFASPYSLNNHMVLPDATVGNISNWLEEERLLCEDA